MFQPIEPADSFSLFGNGVFILNSPFSDGNSVLVCACFDDIDLVVFDLTNDTCDTSDSCDRITDLNAVEHLLLFFFLFLLGSDEEEVESY